ncbi:hypothetical protein [Mycolicibacterium llatzerense]|uniref:hypothetical protein n=1 Tax=Mycolicibacterium llatzerense TaxID=280871 RepID=UPI0008DD332D|nr:hypothetical protein [Mycolicibacterium llatzerense]
MPTAIASTRVAELPCPDQFDLPRRDAHYRIACSRGEFDKPGIVHAAQRIHGQSYVNYGYFEASGLTDDGRLVPELDGTRSQPGGKVVANYLVASPLRNRESTPTATVRLLDIGPYGSLSDLPTYAYFADTFSEQVKRHLDRIVEAYGPQSIREIAALATIDTQSHRGSYELIRAMTQNSMLKAQANGYPELYVASLTTHSLGPVVRFIGRRSATVLGESVQIFSADTRSRSIMVTPVLIDLSVVVDNIADELGESVDESRRAQLEAKAAFLTDGLDTVASTLCLPQELREGTHAS